MQWHAFSTAIIWATSQGNISSVVSDKERLSKGQIPSVILKWYVPPPIPTPAPPPSTHTKLSCQYQGDIDTFPKHICKCVLLNICTYAPVKFEPGRPVQRPEIYRNLITAIFVSTGCGSSIGSEFAWHASGPEFDPHVRHILSWRLGHENISTAILPLSLIQEEQLSVTGERMCTKYW